jgi:hypothetical protein
VTPETKLEVGPIAIPIGMGMIVLGRLVQGPRLRAELHERDGELVLSAQLSGLRRSPSWRIRRKLESPTTSSRIAALHDMIPELACRMFTNLGVQRKVKWRAMQAFTEGLEIYRRCLRTPQDRAVKLIEAQQHFVQALAEDEDFVLVYYNLGVVFSELSRIAGRAGQDRCVSAPSREGRGCLQEGGGARSGAVGAVLRARPHPVRPRSPRARALVVRARHRPPAGAASRPRRQG